MATPNRPNQRDHILDTALGLISEHGAAAMSMRQLAQCCGLGVAALYHYFPSKDALVGAVIEERRYGARLAELAELPQLPTGASVEVRLGALFAEVWRGALEEESIWRVLLGEGVRGEALVLPIGADLLRTVHAGLQAWIATELPEFSAPGAVAEMVIGQLFAGFLQHIFEPNRTAASIAESGARALITALCPPR